MSLQEVGLQPRILKTVTPLSVKEQQRENLQSEIEKYIANGGTITPLSFGFTHFKDGILPRNKTGPKVNNDESVEKTQKTNEAIRLQKEEVKQAKLAEMERKKEERTKKAERRKKQLQEKAANKPKTNSQVQEKPKKEKVNRIIDPTESERRSIVSKRSKEAISLGLKKFTAPCKHHGETEYAFFKNGTRCCKCRSTKNKAAQERRNLNPQYRENKVRKEANRKSMMAALEQGLLYFDAECINCGMTKFKAKQIKKRSGGLSHHMHCVVCMNKAGRIGDKKRQEKRKALRLIQQQEQQAKQGISE